MNTKTLSTRALSVIDQYEHFRFGSAVSIIPYFNNKTARLRAALRARGGKGSPKDIYEEVQTIMIKNHLDQNIIADQTLTKLLVDENIGIDCSSFAYYVLNAESVERGKSTLDKHISFTECHGLIGKIRCSLRPVENCDVRTFANNKNSRVIPIGEVQTGDIITMLGKKYSASVTDDNPTSRSDTRTNHDHILVIYQLEYQNFKPIKMHYVNAVAYPEDGVYGTGVKKGTIEISNPTSSITEQKWNEYGHEGLENKMLIRAQNSITELRRLQWF